MSETARVACWPRRSRMHATSVEHASQKLEIALSRCHETLVKLARCTLNIVMLKIRRSDASAATTHTHTTLHIVAYIRRASARLRI